MYYLIFIMDMFFVCSPGIVSKFWENVVLRVPHVKEKKLLLYRIMHVWSSQVKNEESEVVLVPMARCFLFLRTTEINCSPLIPVKNGPGWSETFCFLLAPLSSLSPWCPSPETGIDGVFPSGFVDLAKGGHKGEGLEVDCESGASSTPGWQSL